MDEIERLIEALKELMYRNPQKHDGHAYELELAAWGLGLVPDRPDPLDYGQPVYDKADIDKFASRDDEPGEDEYDQRL